MRIYFLNCPLPNTIPFSDSHTFTLFTIELLHVLRILSRFIRGDICYIFLLKIVKEVLPIRCCRLTKNPMYKENNCIHKPIRRQSYYYQHNNHAIKIIISQSHVKVFSPYQRRSGPISNLFTKSGAINVNKNKTVTADYLCCFASLVFCVSHKTPF